MTFARVLALIFVLTAGAAARDVFDLKVSRVRMLLIQNQPGDLHIDAKGVTFLSSNGQTAITIPMQDLREADVVDAHALQFGLCARIRRNRQLAET
jgi:hypothetical protein